MMLIAITSERDVAGEAYELCRMIEAGISRVHIRKPRMTLMQMRNLLSAIPVDMRRFMSLHDHFNLATEMGMGGIHINRRNWIVPDHFNGLISRSSHSIKELAADTSSDYVFLSPIFDSISKSGYMSGFSKNELSEASTDGVIGECTVALGGITPERLPYLSDLGFGGAAFLGYIWHGNNADERFDNVLRIINGWKNCSL